jgi:ComF family protein
MSIWNRLALLLFPPKCVLCGELLEKHETDLCRHCRAEGPVCTSNSGKLPFLDGWTAVWYYEDQVRRSLLRYKFYRARSYAPCYGRMLAMKVQQSFPEGVDILTWVPISPLRKLRRGYDQVELLAEAVGQELGIQPQRVLKKIRHNRPQSGIVGQAQRRANVLGVYRVTDPAAIAGKSVLLLDDILTTGATVSECARTLLTAGAKEVICATVAVASHQRHNSR